MAIKSKLVAITILIATLGLSGCTAAYIGSDTAQSNVKIQSDFTKIPNEDNLYFCNDTMIVYWIGGSYTANVIGDDYTTSYMTAYYAPNGLPYRYEDGELKEIKNN